MVSQTTPAVPQSLYRRLKQSEFARFVRFGVVGASGVVVNMGLAWLGHAVIFAGFDAGLRVNLSNLIGILVSIFTNFVLNDVWTWGDRPKGGRRHWYTRMALYYVFAAAAAGVQLVTVNLLTHWWVEWPFLLATFCGIAAGILINYPVNNYLTFRAGRGTTS